jgi:hypothetical protein
MAGAADFVQKAVYTRETGKMVVWIKCTLAILAIATLGAYNLYYFRGPATTKALDQAQIGRKIASLSGYCLLPRQPQFAVYEWRIETLN